jgi:sulfate adenylyltransferase subunit 1
MEGDMVVERGTRLDWYRGPTVVELLENAPSTQLDVDAPLRFPVQWVCRPSANGPRGYAGRIEAGRLAVSDEVTVLTSGLRSRVTRIALGEAQLPRAHAGQSVTVSLADERDISRGDMLVRADDAIAPRSLFSAALCWLDSAPLAPARTYLLRQGTRIVKARIGSIDGKLDIHALAWNTTHDSAIGLNDIARITLKTQQALVVDPYRERRATGSFILIDEASNNTVAAGVFD